MNATLIDRKGTATRLAAEGSYAIGCGYTTLAAQKYAEAGQELERNLAAARKAPDRHLLRFLAATQYYLGGHYQRAFNLSKYIEARFLSPGTRELLPKFLKDVQERSSPNYKERIRKALSQLWLAKEFQKVLDVLKEHQFVYGQGTLAFLRAVICEELEQWKAAAVFYAMAIPDVPDGSDFMLMAVGRVLGMHSEGRIEEAWAYISHLQKLLPNAVTNTVTSITSFFRASKATGEDRLLLHRDQLRYFEDGRRAYQMLPTDRRNHPEMLEIMSMGFNAALMALKRLSDDTRFRALADEAILMEPNNPGPYLQLAEYAFRRGQFSEAERLCNLALTKSLSNVVRAQVLGCLAVFQDCLGKPGAQIESLFRQAFDLDPGNENVATNYKLFMDTVTSTPVNGTKRWSLDTIRKPIDTDNMMLDISRISGANRNARVRDVLLAGAM